MYKIEVVGEVELGVNAFRNRPGCDAEDVTAVFLVVVEYCPLCLFSGEMSAVMISDTICHNLGITPMKVGECKAIELLRGISIALLCLDG
jgi:hypothetical protein